jgi:signal transduction histidine kinase
MAVKSSSLRARMAAAALLVSTLTAVVLVIGVQVLLARSNDATAHSRLTTRATAAAATVVGDNAHGLRILEQRSPVLDQNVWIFDKAGRLVDGRLSQPALARSVRSLATVPEQRQMTADEVTFYALPVLRNGQRIATVVAAEYLEPYEVTERHSLYLSLLLGAGTVVVATAAAWAAATRSLRQVQAMSDLADDWREHDLSARFDPGPGGDEIAQLGRTLDLMLDRIVDALSAERRLTDEIAHELRTPLSVILAEADLARSTATASQREGLEGIHAAALRMRDSIDTMLVVARAHAGGRDDRTTVGQLLESLGLPPSSYDDVMLAAPASPLAAAVRPLLDNAHRHGSGDPRVEVTREAGTVVIAILDDGPGVTLDQLETVFEPGHTTRPDGSGLGLPLARRMARAVGADLVAQPGPGGRFEVRAPAR